MNRDIEHDSPLEDHQMPPDDTDETLPEEEGVDALDDPGA